MVKIAYSIGVILILFPRAIVSQDPVVDWEEQKAESLRHYRSLIQLDSSNPPGNETLVVDYLRRVFESEGISVKTFAVDAARANLVARIQGNGSKRPILLMAHTDVVGVQESEVAPGPIRGRGQGRLRLGAWRPRRQRLTGDLPRREGDDLPCRQLLGRD